MISLSPLIRHLTPKPADFAGLWFRKVAGSAEYAQIHVERLPLPACWVVRSADRVDALGTNEDAVTPSFDVVIAIENARSHAVGDTDDLLLIYRRAVYARLRSWVVRPDVHPMQWMGGWENTQDVRPIKWRGGRVLEYTNDDLYWADSYDFDAVVNNYLPDPPLFDRLTHTGETL